MRVGFPVIFIRDGKEYAGITVTSSAKLEQIPKDPDQPLTRRQRFGELRCSIAFFDPEIRGWRQADNVPYLSIELAVPAEGDFYCEVGAPDPEERAAAAAEWARKKAEFDALPPEEKAKFAAANGAGQANELAPAEIRSPDPVDDVAAPLADRQGPAIGAAPAEDETSELEARPIG